MAEEKKKSFVLTDESINSSGFWVRTAGGDLSQFRKNPIMLWMHSRVWKGTDDEVLPIGRWDNVTKTEEGQLIAEPVFDENDPFAVRIKNKVDGGFLRMASIGIRVIETSADAKYLKQGQTRETVTKWKLVEVSICDIGRNENALAFYDENDNLLTFSGEKERECPVKRLKIENGELKMKGEEKVININIEKMNELVKLLKLADGATEADVAASVTAIISERDALRAEKDAADAKLAAERKAEAETLTDAAIKDGRVNDDEKHGVRASWIGFFEKDFEGAKQALAAIPAPKSVKEQMQGDQMPETNLSLWAKRQEEIEKSIKN
jgi:hypothetical protein